MSSDSKSTFLTVVHWVLLPLVLLWMLAGYFSLRIALDTPLELARWTLVGVALPGLAIFSVLAAPLLAPNDVTSRPISRREVWGCVGLGYLGMSTAFVGVFIGMLWPMILVGTLLPSLLLAFRGEPGRSRFNWPRLIYFGGLILVVGLGLLVVERWRTQPDNLWHEERPGATEPAVPTLPSSALPPAVGDMIVRLAPAEAAAGYPLGAAR